VGVMSGPHIRQDDGRAPSEGVQQESDVECDRALFAEVVKVKVIRAIVSPLPLPSLRGDTDNGGERGPRCAAYRKWSRILGRHVSQEKRRRESGMG